MIEKAISMTPEGFCFWKGTDLLISVSDELVGLEAKEVLARTNELWQNSVVSGEPLYKFVPLILECEFDEVVALAQKGYNATRPHGADLYGDDESGSQ